jgi:hypothetical protein
MYSESEELELKKDAESLDNSNKKHKIPFWTEDPNILFTTPEFFPVESMKYAQKLNAISRTLIVVSVVLYILTRNVNLLLVLGITLFSISLLYFNHKKDSKKVRFEEEFATNPSDELAEYTLEKENVKLNRRLFDSATPSNPFSNVLVTDYEYNPNKKTAPASYTSDNETTILDQAKELVKQANPDQPDIANKLFKDLGEELQFEQSMRPFYSTSATTIPNDQEAFADFCYGSMVSCKEGNMFACARKYQAIPAI